MWKAVFQALCLASCLSTGLSWNGFYTTEYAQYTLTEQTITLVFTLEAPLTVVKKAPLSLSTVLDASGSMQGPAMDLLKGTTQFLVRELAKDGGLHDVGLVSYDSAVEELTPLIPVTASNVELLTFYLDSMVASGNTFLSAGLNLGVQQQATAPFGKVKSVYLFSDGIPNVGPTTLPEILGAVDSLLASSGDSISISTFGMGNNVDYGLLSAIAERGGGEAYLLRRPEDIPIAFGKALGGLTTIVGTDIEVVFTAFPGCRIKSVTTGGVFTTSTLTVLYGNLFAGEFRDILFEVEIGVAPVGFEQCLKTEYFYVDAYTRERTFGGELLLEIERVFTAPVVLVPAYRVEENRLKYFTADACLLAKQKLLEGDKQGALDALLSAKSSVEASPAQDSTILGALLSDLDGLLVEVESDDEADVLKLGKLGSFVSALQKQRSTSTEKEEFQIDDTVETEEQKTFVDTLADDVFNLLGIDETQAAAATVEDIPGDDEEFETGDEEDEASDEGDGETTEEDETSEGEGEVGTVGDLVDPGMSTGDGEDDGGTVDTVGSLMTETDGDAEDGSEETDPMIVDPTEGQTDLSSLSLPQDTGTDGMGTDTLKVDTEMMTEEGSQESDDSDPQVTGMRTAAMVEEERDESDTEATDMEAEMRAAEEEARKRAEAEEAAEREAAEKAAEEERAAEEARKAEEAAMRRAQAEARRAAEAEQREQENATEQQDQTMGTTSAASLPATRPSPSPTEPQPETQTATG